MYLCASTSTYIIKYLHFRLQCVKQMISFLKSPLFAFLTYTPTHIHMHMDTRPFTRIQIHLNLCTTHVEWWAFQKQYCVNNWRIKVILHVCFIYICTYSCKIQYTLNVHTYNTYINLYLRNRCKRLPLSLMCVNVHIWKSFSMSILVLVGNFYCKSMLLMDCT